MPMSAEEFNSIDPDIRSFYHNCNQINLAICGGYFSTLGYTWYPRSAAILAQHNKSEQLYRTGTYNLNAPIVELNWVWEVPIDSIPIELGGYDYVSDTLYWVPMVSYDYPGPPRKVRKTYWTGVSRRRRNLA